MASAEIPGRMIAVAFGPATMAEALERLEQAAAVADAAEIRLDAFREQYDLAELLAHRGCPLIVTLRPVEQGGASTAPAEERFRVLLRAAELGAEYIDLEWDAATPERLAALWEAGARAIVSRHEFDGMPADLDLWWDDLAGRGAPIVKIVGMARDPLDCLAVLHTLRRADRPTIAVAMGEAGLATRILGLREPRCLLTFAALEAGQGTAPGQIAVRQLREDFHAAALGPDTVAYGLLGPHQDLERAAQYNRWFAAAGIDAVAVPFVGADSASTVDAFRALPMAGWHLHGAELQETVGQVLDEIDASACRIGRVNAVVARDGALHGAWVESPEEQFSLWTGRRPAAAGAASGASGGRD